MKPRHGARDRGWYLMAETEEGPSVKDIRIIAREDHQITDEIKGAVDLLNRSGIPARKGEEKDGYGVVQIEDDTHVPEARRLLCTEGFKAFGPSQGFGDYQ